MKGTLKTPHVQALLAFFEQQAAIIQRLITENQKLQDEIVRLKNQLPKPDIEPGSLGE